MIANCEPELQPIPSRPMERAARIEKAKRSCRKISTLEAAQTIGELGSRRPHLRFTRPPRARLPQGTALRPVPQGRPHRARNRRRSYRASRRRLE